MSLLRLAYIIAVRRTLSNWKLEMVLFVSIIMAVALLSSGVIFSDLVAETALRHSLNQAAPEEVNIQVRAFVGKDTPPTLQGRIDAYQANLRFAGQHIGPLLQPYLKAQSRLLETPTFFFAGHPQLELEDRIRPRGDVQFLDGLWPQRVDMVQGRWPYTGADGSQFSVGDLPPDVVELAVDREGMRLLGLRAGDEMEIFPAASFIDPPRMNARIVGIFERKDPEDEFWYGYDRDFSFQDDRWTMIPTFTSQAGIVRQMVSRYPSLFLDMNWFYYLDREAVRAGDVNNIQGVSRTIKQNIKGGLANGTIDLRLDRVLEDYKDELLPTRVPMFLILFLVTGILIYYVGLACGLIVKSRNTELALLKSRGATSPQLGLLAFVESLMLAVPAVIIGPFLALAVVGLLGDQFFGLGGGGELANVPVALTSQAFLLGMAGGGMAVIALTGFTLMASRQSIVEFRQSGARPPQAPFVHRYYLDILLLVPIVVLWLQLRGEDSFLVRSAETGELTIDKALLLVPLLTMLIASLLVLRVFPILLALSSRIAEPIGPPWLVHGLRHLSRDPIVPGMLVVMLMLSTALGVIGSTFSSTFERSQRDRALYAAGADLMLEHRGTGSGGLDRRAGDFGGFAENVDGVQYAVDVRRTVAGMLTKGFSAPTVSILAVDSETFGEVAWYRSDFVGGKSFDVLISLLESGEANQTGGQGDIRLPSDASQLAVWVQPNRPDSRLHLRARLKDSTGFVFDMQIGDLGFQGWQQVTGDLVPYLPRISNPFRRSATPLPEVSPPFSLLSVYLVKAFGSLEPGVVFIGRLSVVTPQGEVVVDDFGMLENWHIIEDYSRPGVSYYALEASGLAAPVGNGKSAAFSWAPGGSGIRGIRNGWPENPVPAIVSRSFVDEARVGIGDTVSISLSTFSLPLEIVEVADYFPTLDPEDKPFAVVDLKQFIASANYHSPNPVGGANELWINLEDGSDGVDGVIGALRDGGLRFREASVASDMVALNVDQPLVNAGWGALLVLVFLVLAVASSSGMMLFSYIHTLERQTEFALLRTIGSTRKQLNGVVWFGLAVIVAFGIGLGSWVGLQTAISLLSPMGVAEEGVRVVPPMVLKANWTILAASYLVMLAVTLGVVVWLAWFAAKLELQRALRIGER